MKKLLFLLLLAPLFAFSQLDTRTSPPVCGYQTSSQAFSGGYYAKKLNSFENPDETFSYTDVSYNGTSWCFTNTYHCSGGGYTPQPNPIPYRLNGKALDTRTVRKCGYANGEAARIAGEKAQKTAILADETWSSTTWDAHCTSNCCYEVTFLCTSQLPPVQPLNKEVEALPVPTPSRTNVPALQPYTSCTKKVYGPNLLQGYPSCQEAENAVASWVASKTSVILESVDTFQWGSGDGWENWGWEIHYTTSGSCYK